MFSFSSPFRRASTEKVSPIFDIFIIFYSLSLSLPLVLQSEMYDVVKKNKMCLTLTHAEL